MVSLRCQASPWSPDVCQTSQVQVPSEAMESTERLPVVAPYMWYANLRDGGDARGGDVKSKVTSGWFG